MTKKVKNIFDLHEADWPGMIISAAIAFAIGLVIYEPLAEYELVFFVFEDFSIAKTVGSWNNISKYITTMVFSMLAGFAYHSVNSEWDLVFAARLPLALLLGVLGMAILVVIIGFIVGALALLALLLALFFGRGDR